MLEAATAFPGTWLTPRGNPVPLPPVSRGPRLITKIRIGKRGNVISQRLNGFHCNYHAGSVRVSPTLALLLRSHQPSSEAAETVSLPKLLADVLGQNHLLAWG